MAMTTGIRPRLSILAAALALGALGRPATAQQLVPLAPPAVDDGCAAVITPAVQQELAATPVDPEVAWEEWRQKNHVALESSPLIRCRHNAWKQLHATPGPVAAAAVDTSFVLAPLAATIGTNLDPANGVQDYQGEVQIAVHPTNPLRMVAGANSFYRDPTATCLSPTGGASKTYGTQALYGSTDGGSTWKYACAPWHTAVTGGVAGAVAWFGSDPAMAWDANGNAYAVYMLISQSNGGASGASIVVARSTDSGQTWAQWGSPVVNRIGSTSALDDKEMVAIDQSSGGAYSHTNRVYVIWDEGNAERIAYSDNGATWTTVPLEASGDIGGNVVVGSDGTVYVTWNRYSTTGGVNAGDTTVFSKSTDGGATWTTPVQAGPRHNLASFGTNNKPPAQESRGINAFPAIDVDRNADSTFTGRLYILYNDFPPSTPSGSDVNVYLVTSSDGGATWSGQVKANDDAGTATQFFPWLSVDQSDGTVNVSWYDTRVDTANNRKTQVYYARSTDGGASFEANLLVHDGGTNFVNKVNYSDDNATDNANRNANQYGDYGGMVAANRQAHAFWTDTREFYPTSGDARKEDAATSAIVNCSPPVTLAAPAASCSGGSMVVTWSAPAAWGTNATDGTYTLERYSDAACTLDKKTFLNATSPFTDDTAVVGTSYYYHVVATNNCPGTKLTPMSLVSACSSAAAVCAAGCSQAAPTAPAVTASADGQNTVTWTAAAGAGSYRIYRSTGDCTSPSWLQVATGQACCGYTDTTATPGVVYAYAVTAFGACESAKSACVSVATRGTYSSGSFISGRPQDTATATLPARWIYNTSATTVTPPGIGWATGAEYVVSNDRLLHAMVGGGSGGTWPSGWKPLSMNAPAQARFGVIPTAIGGHPYVIYLGAQDGRVYCADVANGAPVAGWGTGGTGATGLLGDAIQGAIAVMRTAWGGSTDALFAATRNASSPNALHFLNPADGSLLGSFDNGGGGNPANAIGVVPGDPLVDYDRGQVYFASRQYQSGNPTVWAVNAAARTKAWATAIGDVDASLSSGNGHLYAGTNDGRVVALDPATGAVAWTFTPSPADGPVKGFIWADWNTPNLYFSTNGKVWAISDNGSSAALVAGWPVTVPNPSAPLLIGGFVYAGGGDGALHQVSAPSPSSHKSASLGAGTAVVGAPSYDYSSNLAYVGTDQGDVYAITLPLP